MTHELPNQQYSSFLINQGKVEEGYEVAVAIGLLQYGADPFEKDSRGFCAIDYAEQAGKEELVSLMLNWQQWQECRLHQRMGVLTSFGNVTSIVYEFLLPNMLQSKSIS
jgi:hypothetical protein